MAMTCTECGKVIPASEAGMPCPQCGSRDRVVTMSDHGAATEGWGLDAGFAPSPGPWQPMWDLIRSRLDRLRHWYERADGVNVNELRAGSADFFTACYHLKDYLQSDPAVSDEVRVEVEDYVWKPHRETLGLAGDIANTWKHGSRDPGKRACDISRVITGSSGGASVTVTWTGEDGSECSRDCLDLAEQTVREWEGFLRRHGLLEAS
jgi:predicted  nucleic acid-binding Zn-ribbon protein